MDLRGYYTATELAQKFELKIQTVYSRFKSPYAESRWGVEVRKRVDGSIEKKVHQKNLRKWRVFTNSYVGRPTRA